MGRPSQPFLCDGGLVGRALFCLAPLLFPPPPPTPQLFLAVFTVEICFKIIAWGFVCGEGAYLRDSVGVARGS